MIDRKTGHKSFILEIQVKLSDHDGSKHPLQTH